MVALILINLISIHSLFVPLLFFYLITILCKGFHERVRKANMRESQHHHRVMLGLTACNENLSRFVNIALTLHSAEELCFEKRKQLIKKTC